MRFTVTAAMLALALAACTNPIEQASLQYQQDRGATFKRFQESLSTCSQQYAGGEDRGPYELGPQVEQLLQCQNNAVANVAGQMFFPADWMAINTLHVQEIQDVRDKKKTRQMVNAELQQAIAAAAQRDNEEFQRRLGEANTQYMAQQQARSQALMQAGQKLMQGPELPQRHTTSCVPNVMGGFDCSGQ